MMKNNPLKADPSRTATLRRVFVADVTRRYKALSKEIYQVIVRDNAFGIVVNVRFQFSSTAKQMEKFQQWLNAQIQFSVIPTDPKQAYWEKYVKDGYEKGAGRAFDDVRKSGLHTKTGQGVSDFYAGSKTEFLRSSFAQPESIDKVKLLASRTFMDLKGVSEAVSTAMSRTLMDGLISGQNPHVIAKGLQESIAGMGIQRSATIARTEIIRAHAEGQLDAMEKLGVEEVGVMVEWSTAGDTRVCPLCSELEGVVLKIKEAHGLIPRHPNCRCCHLPANVGESTKGQIRNPKQVQEKIDDSIEKEISQKAKREGTTVQDQKKITKWTGADAEVTKTRPTNIAAGKPIIEKPTPIVKPSVKVVKISPIKSIPKPLVKVTKVIPAKPKPKIPKSKIQTKVKSTWTELKQREWENSLLETYDVPTQQAMSSWFHQGNNLFRQIDLDLANKLKPDWNDLVEKASTYGLELDAKELKESYYAFQKFISKAPKYDKKPVYRGMAATSESEYGKSLAKLKPGYTFKENWSVSASRSDEAARGFAMESSEGESKAVKYLIEYQGKSVKVDAIEDAINGEFQWEQEHIIQKGQKWQVKSVTEKKKQRWLTDWDQMMPEGGEPERGVIDLIHVVLEEI